MTGSVTIARMAVSYLTIAGPVRTEIPRIKGSRFIADAAPAGNVPGAEAVIDRIRTEFPDATHHCYAWRLGRDGGQFRFSDDGEPSGTAGRPILQRLEGASLTGVVLVVTRYFGGTKLGAGGLVRAYGAAAAAVLDLARIEEVVVTRRLTVEVGYDDIPALQAFMAAHGIEPTTSDYGEVVRLGFDVPENDVAGFRAELRDRTAGRARLDATPG